MRQASFVYDAHSVRSLLTRWPCRLSGVAAEMRARRARWLSLGRFANITVMRSLATMHVAQGPHRVWSLGPDAVRIHGAHRQHSQGGAIGQRRVAAAHADSRRRPTRARTMENRALGGVQAICVSFARSAAISAVLSLGRGALSWGLGGSARTDDIPSGRGAARGLMHAAAKWGSHCKRIARDSTAKGAATWLAAGSP
jgi:hypothetical protein